MAVDQDAIDFFQPQIDALKALVAKHKAQLDALATAHAVDVQQLSDAIGAIKASGGSSALDAAVTAFMADFWKEMQGFTDDAERIAYLQRLEAVV